MRGRGGRAMLAGMVRLREALGLALLLGAAAWGGCTTNHDALAKQPKAGASSGGSGGSGGQGFANSGNLPSQGGRRNPDDEILGDDVLTIVNGIVDAEGVALCFGRLDADGQLDELVGEPRAELPYATSFTLTELEGFNYADDAIQPWVIAGDLSLIEGLTCADAVALAESEEAAVTPVALAEGAAGAGGQGAGGAEPTDGGAGGVGEVGAGGAGGAASEPEPPLELPALRARPVAAIPPGSLNIGRSILLVMSGCLGGAYYTDAVELAACGEGYAPDSPSLQPIMVKLSRALSFSAVGLQGVQGSLSLKSVDIRSSGNDGAVALTFASDVSFGAIEPRPADTRFSAGELGITARDHGLQAVDDSGVIFQQSWPDIRTASGLSEIIESRTYTAILVGPDPLLIKEGWWNQPAFVLVDNDPTRE